MEAKIAKYAASERAYYDHKNKYEEDKNKWAHWKDTTMQTMRQLGLWDTYIKQLNNEKLNKEELTLVPKIDEFVTKAKESQPEYPGDPNLFVFPLGPYNIYEHELSLDEAASVYQIAKIPQPQWLVDMQEGERLCAEFNNPEEEYFVKAILLRHGADHVDSKTRSTIALNAADQWCQQYGAGQI